MYEYEVSREGLGRISMEEFRSLVGRNPAKALSVVQHERISDQQVSNVVPGGIRRLEEMARASTEASTPPPPTFVGADNGMIHINGSPPSGEPFTLDTGVPWWLKGGLAVLVLGAAGGGGYWWWRRRQTPQASEVAGENDENV